MTTTITAQPDTPTKGLRSLLVLGPILGILTAAALIVPSLVGADGSADGFFTLMPAFIPAVILTILIGNPHRDNPRRSALLAMPPVAFGLITATVVLRYPMPEATGLLLVGAVLSSLPFLAAGLLGRGVHGAND